MGKELIEFPGLQVQLDMNLPELDLRLVLVRPGERISVARPAVKQRLMAVRILDHNFSPAIDRQNQGGLLLFGPPGVSKMRLRGAPVTVFSNLEQAKSERRFLRFLPTGENWARGT